MIRPLPAPCFFTALTTALGFLSLLSSEIPAVRQFGLYGALGVLIAFAVSATLVPLGLCLLRVSSGASCRHSRGPMAALLRACARLSLGRSRGVLQTALLLTAVSLFGMAEVRCNTDLVRFLKPEAPLHRDTIFVDGRLGGVNFLEFMLSRQDGGAVTGDADLSLLASFSRQVRGFPDVAGVLSLADLSPLAWSSPLAQKLVGRSGKVARISVRLRSMGTDRAAPLVKKALAQGRELFGPDYRLVPTGSFYQVTEDSTRLVSGQMRSFGLALVLVLGAIGLLFRSVKLTLISIVPNLIPVLWTAGLMGALGIELSTGTAMIAAVVIGIAVDDTIHFLARYRREFKGQCRRTIFRITFSTGRALVISSVVPAVGFWAGCLGSFLPTIYFSLLTGLTIVGALLCDLLVLPACLHLADGSTGPSFSYQKEE